MVTNQGFFDMSSKPLEVEPEFMKAGRLKQEEAWDPERRRLFDLALQANHRIVLTEGQRIRAKARAARVMAAHREAALERKK